MVVLFGTGKYLEPGDLLASPERPQSFYGIIDRNTGGWDRPRDRARPHAANDRPRARVRSARSGRPSALGDPPPVTARITSDNPVGDSGWYMDLLSPVEGYENEKQVTTRSCVTGT